jgi:hypothetical protein
MTAMGNTGQPPQKAGWVKRIAGEPLLHFLVLGAGLFVLYMNFSNQLQATAPNRIVIDAAQVERLTEPFQRIWMRPPTRQELEGLVADYIKEEVLYREALSLGLDRDDLIIRRRLGQKMEFLNADLNDPPEPTDAMLQAYLDSHMDTFRIPGTLSFRQLYIKPEDAGNAAQSRASHLLKVLGTRAPTAPGLESLGDATLLPDGMKQATEDDISRTFGEEFASNIITAPAGKWSGPFASSFGLHLVYVAQHSPAIEPKLADVRKEVEREWGEEQRRAANDRFYQAMLSHYSVEIDYPGVTAGAAAAAKNR